MDLWVYNWNSYRFEIVKLESDSLTHILLKLGMVLSGNEASRLMKGNAISYRDYHEDWIKVTDYKFKLPDGQPYFLKVGNGMGRLLPDPNSETMKFVNLRGICFVMLPILVPGEYVGMTRLQDIDFWSELWGE